MNKAQEEQSLIEKPKPFIVLHQFRPVPYIPSAVRLHNRIFD
jgi:hypothetical protein